MDESFMPFNEILEKMISINGEIYDDHMGIHSYIYAFDVGTPVELEILRDENGRLQIGTVPPLYRISTSFRPSYHAITFTCEKISENGQPEYGMEP